jgi:hypothetical protein
MNPPENTRTAAPRRDPQALACLAGASASLVLMVLTFWLA